MALVTRCPYCGVVWLLPNKEIAERGPVRCSACNNSFDATRELMNVPEEKFPNLPKPAAHPFTTPGQFIAASRPSGLSYRTHLSNTPQTPVPIADTIASSATTSNKTQTEDGSRHEKPTVQDATNANCSDTHSIPVQHSSSLKKEPPLVAQNLAKIQDKREPHLSLNSNLDSEKRQSPLSMITPSSPEKKGYFTYTKTQGSSSNTWLSWCFGLVLLTALSAISCVAFNQQIISAVPSTQIFYKSLCGVIPCPGFYLSDPSAFTINSTQMKALDAAGNYQLDVTLTNDSEFSQSAPWLEIALLDENDTIRMKKSLSPQSYLSNPDKNFTIAPHRKLTIRMSLQTNISSARCQVKPLFSTP